jgi:serine/threonine-protein kinase
VSDQKICPTCGTEYPLSERFCPRDGSALRSAEPQADLLGSIIADRYHILKKLGEGGMGTVYLAEHVKMGRKSALKVMNPGMNTDPDAIARFNREASNASRLSHPNICGIYDFGETPEGMIYLAMEFIEGASLTSLIEKAGALPAPRAASIVHQTADALQVAHDAGIVHRDLKPDNIMIARNRDGSDQVKVVDFGIAKASSSDAQKVTKTGLVVGTPEYMSPEQLAGDKLDGRSDIYSLALVAFNCLTGALPFPSESAQEAMIMRLTDKPKTLAEMKGDVAWPEKVQAIMDKGLARDADDRYQSAAQFGRELAAAVAEMPVTAAAEAGTMVMGAQGGAKARAAATAPMPATRVSRASSKTTPMEATKASTPSRGAAKPAPAKRSATPMVLGGAVGVAAIAAVVWQMGLLGGAGSPPIVTGSDSTNTKVPAETSATVASNGGDGRTQVSGTTPGGTPGKVTPPAGGSTTKSDPPGNGGRTDPLPPRVLTTADHLKAWIAELDTGDPSEEEGSRILREIEPIFASLSGVELAEGWYVRMQAYASMGDARTCDAARQVRTLSANAKYRQTAANYLDLPNCK